MNNGRKRSIVLFEQPMAVQPCAMLRCPVEVHACIHGCMHACNGLHAGGLTPVLLSYTRMQHSR